MEMKRMVSGITTTGKLTLGNYLGALKNFVKLQEEFDMYLFVANLHGITAPIEKDVLKNNIKSMVALYFACGLDPNKATVFLQSDVLEHTQLAWILQCNTTLGELKRMTQFKDKSVKVKAENGTEFIPTGILTYPTLMAADILLYDAQFVPVGKDQKQHVELTRNIAERLNNRYGQMFEIPQDFTTKIGSKIMDLQNPNKKMSKSSLNPKSYIALLDSPNDARKKIKAAVTDSENLIKFDPENKPGVSNLLTIYAALTEKNIIDVEKHFENKNYGKLKNEVADVVCELLENIQESYKKLYDSEILDKWLTEGATKARKIAQKKMQKVLKLVGLNFKK